MTRIAPKLNQNHPQPTLDHPNSQYEFSEIVTKMLKDLGYKTKNTQDKTDDTDKDSNIDDEKDNQDGDDEASGSKIEVDAKTIFGILRTAIASSKL